MASVRVVRSAFINNNLQWQNITRSRGNDPGKWSEGLNGSKQILRKEKTIFRCNLRLKHSINLFDLKIFIGDIKLQ